MTFRILAVYPRRTATLIALFEDREEIMRREIRHDREELLSFDSIAAQWPHRLRALEESLSEWTDGGGDLEVDAVIGPAGIPGQVPGGVYHVDDLLIDRLLTPEHKEHPSDLGAPLADALARRRNARALVMTSLSTEESDPISLLSGIPELSFGKIMHTLNIKDAVFRAADELGIPYDTLSVVVAYLGKSFSICSHREGRILDLSNANEKGPFSPGRSGSVPAADLIRMAYSGEWSMDALMEKVAVNGGMMSYTGTDSLLEVSKRNTLGDMYSGLVIRSMAYQIAQEIAAQATVLYGKVDAIILTGGCTHNDVFVEIVKERIVWITNTILVYPEEDDLKPMVNAALRVMTGKEHAYTYAKEVGIA